MTTSEKLYTEIGSSLKDVELSQMFGKPALKINSKAFACFFKDAWFFPCQRGDCVCQKII